MKPADGYLGSAATDRNLCHVEVCVIKNKMSYLEPGPGRVKIPSMAGETEIHHVYIALLSSPVKD